MTLSFHVSDPEASVTYPVTDSEGGNVDWASPQVRIGETSVTGEWQGAPAPTRDLLVPLDDLEVGIYELWLNVPFAEDIELGSVEIVSGEITVPSDSGCMWPVDTACLSDAWAEFAPDVRERAIRLASLSLNMLTAGRVGGCPITVRPQGRGGHCFIPTYGGPPWSLGMNVSGHWVNNCGMSTDICEVPLPHPVGRVDEVRVDGDAIDAADYRIDNGRMLVWQGTGDCPWPYEQDMNLPDSEVGTFSVTFLNAYPVDAAGAHAAGLMAMEYAKACSGSGKCKLPPGVISVVKQGVAMEIRPGNFPDGFTGIREIDAFISSWNPQARRRQTGVWSPDLPQYRHTTIGG